MKLLVLLSSYPFPPRVGSSVIAYNNIKELAKKHSVYLICRDEYREPGECNQFVKNVEFIRPRHQSLFMFLLRGIVNMVLGFPLVITGCQSHELQKRVRELDKVEQFDAILVYGIESIQYCPPSSYGRVIANIEDPQSIKLLRFRKLAVHSLWEKMKLFVHRVVMAHYEDKLLPKMAKVVLLSRTDISDMQAQSGYRNLGFVPYGVDRRKPNEIDRYEQRADGMIVFSGNMFHLPNVDGALFFLQDLFPLVVRDYPSTVLWIVGADPDVRIRDAATRFGEHVVITGRVKDMSYYLKRAKVSICPVRLKIGVQTKILEALSWGTPVVTTSAGNSGIGGLSGGELWVEDDPSLFAGRVVELLRGKNWEALSKGGRQLVSERFSWENSATELEQHILQV